MSCGLYGKLPSKRDFVALAAPRAFLRVFEPWLEAGLRHGRASGEEASPLSWSEAFNTAPIWRFWLGPALCGDAFAGAFMPSVDALGRMFPLTLVAADAPLPTPPDVGARPRWFAKVEDLLLDALDPNAPFDTIAARLASLPPPVDESAGRAAEPDAAATRFAAIRAQQADVPTDATTFWWTIGGGACPERALAQKGMPAPEIFADMLMRRQDESGDGPKGPTALNNEQNAVGADR